MKRTNYLKEAKELYSKERYEDCLELLYKNNSKVKFYVWSLIILYYILSGISISISTNLDPQSSVVAVAGAVVVAVAVAVVTGVSVVAVVAVAGVVAGGGVVVAVAGVAGAVAGAVVAVVVAAAVVSVVAADYIPKKICQIILFKEGE